MDFIKKTEDPNILVKLLKLDIYHSNFLKENINLLLDFLSARYTKKQIYRLFEELEENLQTILLEDTIYSLYNIQNSTHFFKLFNKTKCNIKSLHDNLAKYIREQNESFLSDKPIKNSSLRKKPCIDIDEYKVKIPKNGKELFEYSKHLHNCMSSYFYDISYNNTTIYCFFKNKKIDFAVEIKNRQLIQASGVCNKRLTLAQAKILKRWIERFFGEKETKKVASMAISVEIVYT